MAGNAPKVKPEGYNRNLAPPLQELHNSPPVQTKLEIGKPGDKYEQEADQMADQVMMAPYDRSNMVMMAPNPDNPTLRMMPMPKQNMVMMAGSPGNPTIRMKPQVQRNEQMGYDEEEKVQMQPEKGKEKLQLMEHGDAEEMMQMKCESCGKEGSIQRAMHEEVEEEKVQTKCAECEEKDVSSVALAKEDTLQKKPSIQKAEDGTSHASPSLTASINSTKGQGRPLPKGTNHEMGSKMGADFSSVKVHTDGKAMEMNQTLGARAFAVGDNVYFNKGEYNPSTSKGKHLLAHELTHTLQQKGVQRNIIQRADYDVDGLPPNASSSPKRIFFLRSSTAIPASEQPKIAAFGGSSTNVTLKGLASEEGSDAANTTVINNRLSSVETALNGSGYSGTITKTADVAAGAGNIEYQKMRSVEIIPAGSSSVVPPAVAVVACTDPLAGGANYPTHWTNSETEAQRLITLGKARLSGVRSATTNAALARFFGSSTNTRATTVSGKLTDISAQITRYLAVANHQCVNQCSNTLASNTGTGGGAMLTLCPSFFSSPVKKSGATTVHEAVHGTPSIGGKDIAYGHHRLIEFLDPTQSIQNPDSYALFLQTLDGQAPTVGRPSPDVLHGMTPAEEKQAKRAVAYLEMYLTGTYLQTSTLYERLHRHRTSGAATWPAGFYRTMMSTAAPHFGLTAPPALSSTETDQVRLAAVFHRLRIMRRVFLSPVDITKSAAYSWTAGPGSTVEVEAGFFALTPLAQVLKLMELLVTATPDISTPLEPHYATYMNEIRTLLGRPLPPP